MTDIAAVLVLNVGSSSVKFRVLSADPDLSVLAEGRVTGIGSRPAFAVTGQPLQPLEDPLDLDGAIGQVLAHVRQQSGWRLVAAGHRIVHGGEDFCTPVVLDGDSLARLERYIPLAPLHQRHNLAAVRALARSYPELTQVGCFDTAFHAGHDAVTACYALPASLRESGIRRYGFHGLSYEWIARVLDSQSGGIPERVVVAHLGSGASLCALRAGRSVDTTMGMTALEGLPMGTRCGAIDPGAVLYMLQSLEIDSSEVLRLLHDESGLKGLSGGIADMADLLVSDRESARLAVDYFVLRTAQKIGEMVVSLGGMDTLVFTGGIGENAPVIRERIQQRLGFLPPFEVQLIPADEERMIALHTLNLLERLEQD